MEPKRQHYLDLLPRSHMPRELHATSHQTGTRGIQIRRSGAEATATRLSDRYYNPRQKSLESYMYMWRLTH
ncbi:mannosyl-oligosaccharide 1,2-alpha-mannosidase IA [Lates japonicus]|uniref:Mannosyl-oligosaccharide 1,2-alpha-mannosidase IA n=1 Tax=Lates japonicus TaxID=270547 RepID=A0AAD3N5N6_LATJO|nr:mannosyl-oligosaccharide 1,2-alpha-mannosidase IA [Lates japonicus]